MAKKRGHTFSKVLKDISVIQRQELPIPEDILKLGRPGPGSVPLSEPIVPYAGPGATTEPSDSKSMTTDEEE